jgi:hypothetical protein
MKSGFRVAAAFALAPVLPAVVFALLMGPSIKQFPRFLLVTVIVAYGFAAVVGVPAVLWMRHFGFTLRRTLAAAFLIGFLPMIVLTVIAPARSEIAPSEFLWNWFLLPTIIGAFSTAGGAIFWFLARSALNRPTHET